MPTEVRAHVIADLSGYSRLLRDQGEAEAAKVLRAYERIVRHALVTRDVEIEQTADIFHLIFRAPIDAVRSSVAIGDALARHNERAVSKLRARFGVDAGQSIRRDASHYVGYAPVLASRLCNRARSGQVLITETVEGLIRTANLPMRDLGAWRTPDGTTVHVFEARGADDAEALSASTRFLSALFFTDIVGSTARAATAGDRGWRNLVEEHNAIIREELDRHRGTEIDTAGDGFYAAFDSPSRAIRCALALGDRVRAIGIEIRAGVHLGECELIGGKIGGMSVTIGARIRDKAGAHEVLVSNTVKDALVGTDFSFTDRGRYPLKGVPGQWQIYSVDRGAS